MDRVDPTSNPCEDFYDFACGSFVKRVVLPEDKSSITSISTTNDILSLKLKMLIESEIKQNDTHPTKMVKRFYQSCMNLGRYNAPLNSRDVSFRLLNFPNRET